VHGVIWFSDGCYHSGRIGALETDNGEVTIQPESVDEPLLRSNPAVPGTVVMFDYADHVTVYDASYVDGTPALGERTTRWLDGVEDVQLTADGMLLIGPEVFEPRRYQRLTLLDLGGELVGADWGAERLYAVTKDYAQPRQLHLHRVAVRAPSTVRIKASGTKVVTGTKVRLDLSLATRSTERRVTVKAVTAGGSKVIARPRVPAAGTSLQVEPHRNTTYVASYPGDGSVAPARTRSRSW